MNAAVSIRASATPGKSSSLRSDFSWTLAGSTVYAAGQWLTLVLLAKLTQPELVGQYALGMSIALPVFMLASLQLRMILVADVRKEAPFGHYLSLRLLSAAVGMVVVLAATEALGLSGQLRWVILLVGVAQAIEMVSDIYYARLQLHDRMDRIAKSLILRAVLSAIGLTVGVYLTGNLLWGIAGVAAARFLVFAGYDVLQAAQGQAGSWDASALAALRPRWDAKVQGELLRCSFPLGIVAALVALHSSIPRLFIENSLGERELGIFAALAFLLGAGSMAVVSLGQSAFARLARLYAGGDLQGFLRLLGKLLVWGGALGVSGIVVAQLAGQEILAFLFRPEYAERAALLPWIMAAGTVGYMAQFLGFGMTAARFNHPQVGLFVFTNLVLAAVCYELVPRDGLQGAIFAMLIASIVQFTGSLIILAVRLRGRAGERISRPGQAEESQEASAL